MYGVLIGDAEVTGVSFIQRPISCPYIYRCIVKFYRENILPAVTDWSKITILAHPSLSRANFCRHLEAHIVLESKSSGEEVEVHRTHQAYTWSVFVT